MLLLIILALVHPVLAVPELPTEFYGTARFFNNPAAVGTQIRAFDSNGDLCGTFTIAKQGYYGTLSCNGKDINEEGIGPETGDEITIRISTYPTSMIYGTNANSLTIPTYEPGAFKQINLVVPPLVCGDGFCDYTEGCFLCPEDCGICPVGGGNSSSSGGGSEGGGGDGAGIGGMRDRFLDTTILEETCSESWMCSEWSECMSNGTRTRECVDLNECGREEFKPETSEECEYTPPISSEETPTIITSTETIRSERPTIIKTCDEKLGLFSLPSILFIAIYLIITAISLGRLHHKLKEIRINKKLKDIEKLEKEHHLKKETYIFIITITVIAIIVYLYHYYFFICKTNYVNHLWLLAIFIVISPIIINFFIELMKYHEDEKLAKTVLLYDSHYNHYLKLLSITNTRIAELEKNIIKYTTKLDESSEFYKLLKEVSDLRHAYKEINKLYLLYIEGKTSERKEKKLVEDLDLISKNQAFADAAEEHPELKTLHQDMDSLFKAFQNKQEILDSLLRIQEEYENFAKDSGYDDKSKESKQKDIKNETAESSNSEYTTSNKAFDEFAKDPQK